MINFTLPCFFHNFKLNNYFIDLQRLHPEYFLARVNFNNISGNFPYNYWNGGYNNNLNSSNFTDYQSIFTYIFVPLNFNCSNIFLTEEDLDDAKMNLILELNQTGNNIITVSNFSILKFLQDKYPYYHYNLSREAHLINNFTPEIINSILEKKNFNLIELFPNVDFEFLKKIKNKEKINILIGNKKCYNCRYYTECKINEHINQYNFSNQMKMFNCPIRNDIQFNLTLNDIIEKYIPLNITHFSFDDYIMSNNMNLLNTYIDFFIKDEYKYLVEKNFYKG